MEKRDFLGSGEEIFADYLRVRLGGWMESGCMAAILEANETDATDIRRFLKGWDQTGDQPRDGRRRMGESGRGKQPD